MVVKGGGGDGGVVVSEPRCVQNGRFLRQSGLMDASSSIINPSSLQNCSCDLRSVVVIRIEMNYLTHGIYRSIQLHRIIRTQSHDALSNRLLSGANRSVVIPSLGASGS